ncbi:hypothetical protein [Paenibacillus spiritus]|nr:hypothetical protein [Paenibacillus spiritus]
MQSLLQQFGRDTGYTLFPGEVSETFNRESLKFKQYALQQGYDPVTFDYIPPQERSAAHQKYDGAYFGNLQMEVDAYQQQIPLGLQLATTFGEGVMDGAWHEAGQAAQFAYLAATDLPKAVGQVKDQAGQILYASTHLTETATNAYQMTQQAYTALKQMSPEERARVLGEKAGELAVDALLTKGAGALGKEALNATLETAGTLAQKAGELLPKPGAVLTTPEGIRIPVSEAEADWVRKIEGGVEGTGDLKPQGLMDELANSGVKYNPNDVVAVTRNADGKLVWIENGNSQAGLNHILNHADDFAAKGISQGQLPEFITKAVSGGKIVGYQGKGTGRPIYEVSFNGQTQRVAITTGNNGFIVGANPVSIK